MSTSRSDLHRPSAAPARRFPATVPGALALCVAVVAQAGGLALDQTVFAGGGARSQSAGGCLAVTATLGQEPLTPATGGDFTLAPGLWPTLAGGAGDALFNDGFQECL